MRATCLLLCLLAAACGPTLVEDDDGEQVDAAVVAEPDAALPQPTADAGPVQVVIYAHTGTTLYKIDQVSFDETLVGDFDNDDAITDLAVRRDGALFGVSRTALYRIDTTTGLATLQATLRDSPTIGLVALTFLADDEALLASDDAGNVYTIDPTSGQVDEIGAFGGEFATAGDLVAVSDGTMYGISDKGAADAETNNILLFVNPATGVASRVSGSGVGYGGVFGLAYENGHVYAFTRGEFVDGARLPGQLIEIDAKWGTGHMVREYPGISWYGAAVTPLVIKID